MKLQIALLTLTMLMASIPLEANQSDLRSHAERTDYVETSRYQDVMQLIAQLQTIDPSVRVESFGVTTEGRQLPLVILSKPAISSPAEAATSDKPIVFIMANIHAGEVEGKEASLHLMRDVVTGPLKGLLERIILLVAPIYNADGNEKIDINNRSQQNGPLGGVGTRENAQRLDLNRDFMKLESAEARGLVEGVFNRWDPHVIIDLHTTNGSYHGYALTFSPSLNPNADQRLISFVRKRLLPDVSKTMRTRYKYRTHFYGNFVDNANPTNELPADKATAPRAWATFDHRPRFGNNYVGLRNRLAILSEAYSYMDFRTRVDVTDKFVRTILQYISDHAGEVTTIVREADRHAIEKGTTLGNESGFGVAFELKRSPRPVEILVGSVSKKRDSRTNKLRFEATGEARPVKMIEYGEFQATRRVRPPLAYLLKPDQRKKIDLLLTHGITVEVTRKDETFDVEQYAVKKVNRSPRLFQGHKETTLVVTSSESSEKFPEGSFIVPVHQPKAALIFYLLEAESDDGLVTWNFFDEDLERASKEENPMVYPIYRLKAMPKVPRVILKR